MDWKKDPITPKYLQANGLYNIFTGKKKWQITCGNCEHVWYEKVPLVDMCSAICPCCRQQNVWDSGEFMRKYDQRKI